MKNKSVFLFVLMIISGRKTYSKSLSHNYLYQVRMDDAGKLVMEWNIDYKEHLVKFKILANLDRGLDWFGIGFSDYGDLENADFAVYWVDNQKLHHFQDCWTDGKARLHVDRQQDYIMLTSHTEKRKVILEFTRQFDTCDSKDYQLDNGTTHILYFLGNGRRNSVEGINVKSMKNGLQRVQLLKPDIPNHVFPPDTWTFEIRAPSVHVPATDTTYWWFTTKLPNISEKHHIIQYEGVIQHGSEDLVHHMEVFHCEVGPHDEVRLYNGPGVSEGKPPELSACRNVIGAWAMGAGPFTLPEEAGTPVGGKDSSSFVLLEVHYNNPHLKRGLIDTSGIRFHVTSHLRPYDSGIMELGLEYTDKMAIPPHQHRFPLTGYCIQQCTKIGDALVTTCEYGTLDRQNVTVGGFSIKNEMCVNYIHYYPRTNLEVCKSSIANDALQKYFAFMNIYDGDKTSLSKGIEDNYRSVRWAESNVRLLNTLYTVSPLSMQCNQSDGNRFPGHWEGVAKTKIELPLQKPHTVCSPPATKLKHWPFVI